MTEASPRMLLMVVDDFGKGGAASVVYSLIQGLDGKRFIPVLCCLDAVGSLGKELQSKGYKVVLLGRQPGVDWSLIPKIGAVIRENKVSLVHAHQHTAFFYSTLAAVKAGRTPVVFTEHGRPYPDKRRLSHVVINQLLCRLTSRIIAVSPAVSRSLKVYEGISEKHIAVIYNGIDPRPFGIEVDKTVIRKALGIPSEDQVCGMVARLGSEKDHLTLLRAIKLVRQRLPRTTLVLVGDGPQREGLEEASRKLGLGSKVVFTGQRRDVPELLAIFDLAILSSHYEGTSVTLLEAMAAGKAVVASRVGGTPEVIEDGVTGWLCTPRAEEELAEKMIQLLRDPQLRHQLGGAARRRMKERFTQAQMVTSYERVYNQALGLGSCCVNRKLTDSVFPFNKGGL